MTSRTSSAKRRGKDSGDRLDEERELHEDSGLAGGDGGVGVERGRKRKQPGKSDEKYEEEGVQEDGKSDEKRRVASADKLPFEQGEKVLAYHGDLLYYAKVQEVERDASGGASFFIHYMGWKKSWDEWVGAERLLKDSAANLKKKVELEKGPVQSHAAKEQHSAEKPKKTPAAKTKTLIQDPPHSVPPRSGARGRGSAPSPPESSGQGTPVSGRGRGRGKDIREQGQEEGGAYQEASASGEEGSGGRRAGIQLDASERGARATQSRPNQRRQEQAQEQQIRSQGQGLPQEGLAPELNISIPVPLKKQLVADEERIVQKGELLRLPARPTVCEILDMFLEYRRKELTANNAESSAATSTVDTQEEALMAIEGVVEALKDYFDRTLPLMLLYRQERQQYMDHFPMSNLEQPNGQAANDPGVPEKGATPQALLSSQVYGGEHLLRLFTKLPGMLSYMSMEEDTRIELQTQLSLFLKFMVKHQSSLLPSSNRYIKEGERNVAAGEGSNRAASFEVPSTQQQTQRKDTQTAPLIK